MKWSHWLERPATTVKILVRHLAVDNVVAPEATNQPQEGLPMASIEEAGRAQYRSRLGVLAAWGALLAVAARGALRRELYRPPVLAALGVLAFDFAFHSFFGNDRFLYSCGWTVFTIAVVAAAFDAGAPREGRLGAAATGAPRALSRTPARLELALPRRACGGGGRLNLVGRREDPFAARKERRMVGGRR